MSVTAKIADHYQREVSILVDKKNTYIFIVSPSKLRDVDKFCQQIKSVKEYFIRSLHQKIKSTLRNDKKKIYLVAKIYTKTRKKLKL